MILQITTVCMIGLQRRVRHVLVSLAVCLAWPSWAVSAAVPVHATATYIDVHTGPGRGYPVFHVIRQDDEVTVLQQRADWYQVQGRRGEVGWVPRERLRDLIALDKGDTTLDWRRRVVGINVGQFGSDNAVGLVLGYRLVPAIQADIAVNQAGGRYSDSRIAVFQLGYAPYQWGRFAPYVVVGGGYFFNHARDTLIEAQDTTSGVASLGAGVRWWFARRLAAQAAWRMYRASLQDGAADYTAWTAGIEAGF